MVSIVICSLQFTCFSGKQPQPITTFPGYPASIRANKNRTASVANPVNVGYGDASGIVFPAATLAAACVPSRSFRASFHSPLYFWNSAFRSLATAQF